MNKKLLSLVISVIVTFSMCSVAFASDLTVFTSSLNSSENLTLEGTDGKIIFKTIPSGDSYSYIWAWLESAESTEKLDEVTFASEKNYSWAIDVDDGLYYLQLYKNSSRYGTYNSVYYDLDFLIRVTNGVVTFPMSPVYDLNKKIFSSKRTDATAKSYYKLPSFRVESDNAEIISAAKSITNGITDDYKKALAIHDWVAANIWYDWDAFNSSSYLTDDISAVSTLKNRRSVCQGYASLVAAMLRAVDIPAKVISGYALGVSADSGWSDSVILSETTNHAWNEAFIDNRWVIIDATWDSGNKWENGTKTESTGMLFRKYFDPTLVAFSVDHKIKDYDETKITNSNINSPQSSTDDSTAVATPSRNAVYVDGQRVSIGAYNINGNNFFKLRDLAYVLKDTEKKFSVIYNSRTNTIILSSGEDYTIVGGETGVVSKVDKEAVISSASVKLNGEKAKISGYTIDGNNYFKLRDIGQAFDFNVSFSNNTVIIDTTSNYQP